MSDLFVKPSKPSRQEAFELQIKEPFNLPFPEKNEKHEIYVTAIKPKAPFENEYFDGVSFSKKTLPAEASLVENEGKHFPFRYQTYALTSKQVEAIWEDAKARFKTIPSRPNLNFGTKDDVFGKEYFEPDKVCVADWLLFQKASEFDPMAEDRDFLKRQVAELEEDEGQKAEDQIYQSQAKKKKIEVIYGISRSDSISSISGTTIKFTTAYRIYK